MKTTTNKQLKDLSAAKSLPVMPLKSVGAVSMLTVGGPGASKKGGSEMSMPKKSWRVRKHNFSYDAYQSAQRVKAQESSNKSWEELEYEEAERRVLERCSVNRGVK